MGSFLDQNSPIFKDLAKTYEDCICSKRLWHVFLKRDISTKGLFNALLNLNKNHEWMLKTYYD